jgi:D-sedoheptulose 7-phosphate isomerase
MIIAALRGGGKLISFGNGGSAADSQHIVAELVGRFKKERKPLPALAFTTNTSIISAIANDYSYDVTFSRQMEALGKRGDIVLAISTSGNSPNVLAAVKKAKEMGIKTIGLTGGMGGKLALEADLAIVVSSKDTPRVQESHAMIGHILCDMIEQELCK